jgi:hypothetical protein
MDQIVKMTPKDMRDFFIDSLAALFWLVILVLFYSAGTLYSALCLTWVMGSLHPDQITMKSAVGIVLIFQLLTGSFVKPEELLLKLFVYPSLLCLLGLVLKNLF